MYFMIRFLLPLPPSANALFMNFGKKRKKTYTYEMWIGEASQMILEQKPPNMTDRCIIVYDMQCPNKSRDSGNCEKALTDILVTHGIIKDDSYKYVKGVFPVWNDDKGDFVGINIFSLEKPEDVKEFFYLCSSFLESVEAVRDSGG